VSGHFSVTDQEDPLMRLTLRTLLAYLDGILPAAAQGDLAAQVASTPIAETLVKRIRRTVSRPGVPAPRPAGRGLADDANSVAEYLDNTLPAERLGEFEKICLESDMHLAEVAACHEMLAEAARDPGVISAIDPETRDRLAHAFHHRAALEAVHEERQEARENAAVVMSAVGGGLAGASGAIVTGTRPLPRAGDRKPWLAWASAALAMFVLLTAGGVLTWSVMAGGRRVAARPAVPMDDPPREPVHEAADEPAKADGLPQQVAPAAVPEQPPPKTAEGSAALPSAVTAPPPPPFPAPPASPAEPPIAAAETGPPPAPPMKEEPKAGPDSLPTGGPRVPSGDALAIAASSPVPAAVSPAPQPPVAPPVAADTAIGVVGPGGILLHNVLRAGRDAWVHFPEGADLAERERLAVPPGCTPEIDVGGVVVKFLPGTQAEFSIDPDGTPRITVTFGRVTARGLRNEARLGITAARLHGVVTAGLSAPVGVAVELERQPGDDPTSQRARIRAAIMSTSAALTWRQLPMVDRANPAGGLLAGIPAEGMLEARSTLAWDSQRSERASATVRSVTGWPDVAVPVDRIERRAAEWLGSSLAAGSSLSDSLLGMATDQRVENRSLAASTLALVGSYDALVTLLSADAAGLRLEAAQWLALEAATVPLALARGANSAAALQKAIADRGPAGKAELLFTMARGLSDQELAAGGDGLLVESLDDPDLVVRRYAAKNLIEIVRPAAADRIRYRPDGLPEMRREGAAWWRVQQEKGLVRRNTSR
jgi:hypothetical protein